MKLFKRLSIRWRLRKLIQSELDKMEEAEINGTNLETEKLDKLLNMKSKTNKGNFEKVWTITRDIAGIFVPLMFYGRWLDRGLKFEESGVLCSGTFKSFIGKLNPRKF